MTSVSVSERVVSYVVSWRFFELACQAAVSQRLHSAIALARLRFAPAWQPSLLLRCERSERFKSDDEQIHVLNRSSDSVQNGEL